MEPRKDLSWSMKRALPVYLPITSRGVRILAVDTRMVIGRGGACSDLCTRVPLVALVLRLAFTSPGTSRAAFQAVVSASRVCFAVPPGSRFGRFKLRSVTALLHLIQPLARLTGRLRSGLTFWRYNASVLRCLGHGNLPFGPSNGAIPMKEIFRSGSTQAGRLRAPGWRLRSMGLEARAVLLGFARVLMAVEDHGAGNQFVRLRLWPKWSLLGLLPIVLFASLSAAAMLDGAWAASAIMGLLSLFLTIYSLRSCGKRRCRSSSHLPRIGRHL